MSELAPDCVFCDEQRDGVNTIAENTYWRARWDLFPVNPGHAEVVPKRHVEQVADLSDEELAQIMKLVRRVMGIISDKDLARVCESLPIIENPDNRTLVTEARSKAIRWRHSDPTGFTQGFNDGEDAGQTIMHVHYHIIPRWKGDVSEPRGGIRRIFPDDPYSYQEITSDSAI